MFAALIEVFEVTTSLMHHKQREATGEVWRVYFFHLNEPFVVSLCVEPLVQVWHINHALSTITII